MAVQVFEIKWYGFFPAKEALSHKIAGISGVYIECESEGGKRRTNYIGRSKKIGDRIKAHTQSTNRFTPKSALTFMLGEIYDCGGIKVSSVIKPYQLKNIETFLINNVPNNNPRRDPYTGSSIIIINTGEAASILEGVIALNQNVVDLISTNTKRRKAVKKKSGRRVDPLFDTPDFYHLVSQRF